MGRKGTGVEIREGSIRLSFTLNGMGCKETLKVSGAVMAPTSANIKFANRLAADVRRAIEAGTFSYEEFFPDSKHATKEAPNAFGMVADMWLASKGQLSAASVDQYGTAVRFWKEMFGTTTPMPDLTHQKISYEIGRYKWPTAKTHNNYLIALRGIFGFEYSGRRTGDNPLIGIRNLKTVKKLPDPLIEAERDRVLADMLKRYDIRVYAYYTFAFYTGMRPEEMIALRYGDIDFNAGIAKIQRVRTFKGSERDGTKTHTEREVDLVAKAMEAVELMKQYTFLKKNEAGEEADIFENPVTGRAWHDERSQRDHYWYPSLKRLGIRKRRSYATRHTYCTTALMHGVNPAYIASQAGHSVKTLLEKYARWIPGADGGNERRRLEAAMGGEIQNTSLNLPQKNQDSSKSLNNLKKLGRHDWTRTNDPYHVKVVL